MSSRKIVPAALAALIALGATGAAVAETGEKEGGGEIAAVLGAKTSIVQAIAAAEQQAGGRAMKAGVTEDNGKYVYEIKTATKDKLSEVFVDPATGKVVRADDEGAIERLFEREDQNELAKLAASPTTLASAVSTAEQNLGGTAVEAGIDQEDGATIFEVEVAKDNAVHKVMVDPTTGKVVAVKAAEDNEHDED
jgi:uncharacterized membrane protein YkoI